MWLSRIDDTPYRSIPQGMLKAAETCKVVFEILIRERSSAMALSDIKVASGSWLVANCADFPSEKNCRLVIMGPSDQREDLVAAAAAHAVNGHGHPDSPQLRNDLGSMPRAVEV